MRSRSKQVLLFAGCVALVGQWVWVLPAAASKVTEPPPEVVLNEISTRQIFGLDVDPARVKSLLADPLRSAAVLRADLFGMTMTKDEIALVSEQAKVQQAASSLVNTLTSKVPDSYGGGRVEPGPDRRGRVTVYATGELDAIRSEVAAVLGRGVSFRILQVKHSQRELMALASVLKDALVAGSVSGTTGVDDDRNSVVVTVEEKSNSLPKEVEQAVTDGLAVIERTPGSLQPTGLYKNQPIAYQLVEGGQHISRSAAQSTQDFTAARCTSGWAVYNSVGTYILTAGHCFGNSGSCSGWSSSEIWYQGGSSMGNAANCDISYDAGAISTTGTRNNWGRIHNDYSDWASTVFLTSGGLMNGMTMCNTGVRSTGEAGYASPKKCGVVTATSACGQTTSANCNFFKTDFYGCQGDSGAAVYRDTPTGRSAEGMVHAGSIGSSTCSVSPYTTWVTKLPAIMSYWGLSMSPS
jgi:V8-like Glu-specific endopeptidase